MVVVLALLLGGAAAWLMAGPRNLTGLSETVIERLQPPAAPFELRVGKVELHWDVWHKPASLRLSEISIVSAAYDTELNIPEGRAELALLPLLWGSLDIEHLMLSGFSGELHLGEEHWYIVNAGGQLFYRFAAGDASEEATLLFPARKLTLEANELTLKQLPGGMKFPLRAVKASLEQQDNGRVELRYDAALALKGHAPALSGGGTYDMAEQSGELNLTFDELNPAFWCAKLALCEGMPGLDMPLGGQATLRRQKDKQTLQLNLSGGKGVLEHQPHLPDPIALDALALKATVDLNNEKVKIEDLRLNMATGTMLTARGILQQIGDAAEIELDAEAANMPVNHLYRYWPEGLAAQSREWSITNIREGEVPQASIKLRVTPEDYAQPDLPDHTLAAQIQLKDTTVDYLPGFPKINVASGTVRFTGTTMSADLTNASAMSATKLDGSTFTFTDLNAPGTPAETTLKLATVPKDMASIKKRIGAKNAGQFLAQATGDVRAEITLGFNAFSEKENAKPGIDWDAVTYNVQAEMNELNHVQAGEHIRLDALSGKVNYDASGKQLDVTATWPVDMPYLSGNIPVKIKGRAAPGQPLQLSGSMDLTPARMNIPHLGYSKPAGAPAQFTLSPPKAKSDASAFLLDAGALRAEGALVFNAEAGSLSRLQLDTLTAPGQQFAGSYQLRDGVHDLSLRGTRLDLSSQLDDSDGEKLRLHELPPFNLKLDLDEVLFGPKAKLNELVGTVNCERLCESAFVTGSFSPAGALQFKIAREGRTRRLTFKSDQLGRLMKLADSESPVYGGAGELIGTYRDDLPGSPLEGRLRATDFYVREAPLLGRILNAGSLVGLLDALNGDGIRFSKAASDVRFAGDVLTLSNGKAAGPAMGVLVEGEVNLTTDIIDLRGNVAPAYVLNSLVGKVPLLGELLVGGKGESVIAINYTARGNVDDPSVVVNPLSALTPGFTRRFFDIFDSPPDTSAPDVEKKEKVGPKPTPEPTPAPQTDDTKWQVINP